MRFHKKISSWKKRLRSWLNSRRNIRKIVSKLAAQNVLDLAEIRRIESNTGPPSPYLTPLHDSVNLRRASMRLENKKWKNGWRKVVRTLLSPRAAIRQRNFCPSFDKYNEAYHTLEKLEILILEWRTGLIGKSANEYYRLEATAEKCREIVKQYERNYWRQGNPLPFPLRMPRR